MPFLFGHVSLSQVVMNHQDEIVVIAAICTIAATVLGVPSLICYVCKAVSRFFKRCKLNKILRLCSRISTDVRETLQTVDEIENMDRKYERLNYAANQICKDEDGLVDKLYEAYRDNRSVKQIIVGKALRELRDSKDEYREQFEKQKEEDIEDSKGAKDEKASIKSLRQEKQKYVSDADVPEELRSKLNKAYGKYRKLVERKLEEIEDKVAEIDKEIRSNI